MRAFLLLALLLGAHAFDITRTQNSKNHQDITEMAILLTTAKVCESVEGFTKPEPLNTKALAASCKKDAFASNFEKAIKIITDYNDNTDIRYILSDKYHFHSEKFLDGKALIIKGIEAITTYIKAQKFEDARKMLGEILHTLQDFYSHSNWIELGNTEPCSALINIEENIPNIAGENTETCDSKATDTKTGAKILDTIIKDKVLTSGYIGLKKKKGKCSHGGKLDFTTGFLRSWDGINKDAVDSSHGAQHHAAADMAVTASVNLLEKIWKNNDDPSFFRLMGLHMDKPK